MLVQLLVLAWVNPDRGPALSHRLNAWDAAYYGSIAAHWYPHHLVIGSDGALQSGYEFAFFPLFPTLVAFVHLFGLSISHSLLLTAALDGIGASILVHLLGRDLLGSRRAGWAAAALLGLLPMAIALQMGYAESLYVALTAGALLLAYRERWWAAGLVALLAGLTRPGGVLVPLVIPLVALGVRRAGRSVRWPDVTGATLVGLCGAPLFWLYLWIRTGVAKTWFKVEKHGWDSHFDLGNQTADFLKATLRNPDGFTYFMAPATALIMIGYLAVCVGGLASRRLPPVVVLGVLSVAMTLGSTNYWHSKPRLLLSAFPLVLLAAGPLGRLRFRASVPLVVLGLFVSAWFGAYVLDRWPYAM
jgi:hypothetical protein